MSKIKLEHYVVFSIVMVIAMTIAVLILTAMTDNDYSTIYSVFCGIFGGEILTCGLIKIFKLRRTNGDMDT